MISPWTQKSVAGIQDCAKGLGADNFSELGEKVQTVETQEEELRFERRGNIRYSYGWFLFKDDINVRIILIQCLGSVNISLVSGSAGL